MAGNDVICFYNVKIYKKRYNLIEGAQGERIPRGNEFREGRFINSPPVRHHHLYHVGV